jgi:microsomal epoxide hydrolase
MMSSRSICAGGLCLLALLFGTAAAPEGSRDGSVITSDGVRLHYLEAGPRDAPTIVFVPGWAMPAWIWRRQIAFFARRYHVVAMDPRGQGDSDVPATGYDQTRRGADIGEVIAHVARRPVLLVGWSLGVLDSLAYIDAQGDGRIAGLVLVDNSVGEEPAPVVRPVPPRRGPPPRPIPYDVRMAAFVRAMFKHPVDPAFVDELTDAAVHLPEPDAKRLLAYPVPRSFWRHAIYSTAKPVLYAVRPGLAAQAANLAANHPATDTEIFADAGHALFVDDADRFDALMQDFISRRIWP